MAYGVIFTDNVKATKDGNIKSGKFYVTTTPTAIENGNLVAVDGLLTGERELFKAVAPIATSTNLYVVATPEIIYDEQIKENGALDKFKNEANQPITLIGLEVGDIISLTDECLSATGAVGKIVEAQEATKWKVVDTLTGGTIFHGKIIDRKIYKNDAYINGVLILKVR